jgi:hypothetical protein
MLTDDTAMIELLNRNETLSLNKSFASFIVDLQSAKYNPSLDYNKYKPGNMYVEDDEKSRYVTQEECDKWNEEELAKYEKSKDNIEVNPIKTNLKGEPIYTFPKTDINNYIENLSDSIVKLCERLEWKSVIFLLEYSTPWLFQNNDYEPVKKALQYLKSIGATDNFNGGFKASGKELKELTKNLFWIIRCNAALPHCYFTGLDTDFTADICKHGNIHFRFYSESNKIGIEKLAQELTMKRFEEDYCYDNFSETGVIKGRKINV